MNNAYGIDVQFTDRPAKNLFIVAPTHLHALLYAGKRMSDDLDPSAVVTVGSCGPIDDSPTWREVYCD